MMTPKQTAEFIADLFEPLSVKERRLLWKELKLIVPYDVQALFLEAYSNMTKRSLYPPGTIIVPKRNMRVMVAKTMMREIDIDASYAFDGTNEERYVNLPVTVIWSSATSHLRGLLFASGEFEDGTLMGYATLESLSYGMMEKT